MINFWHSAGIVAVCAVVTALLRFLPFWLFPEDKELPPILVYLSKVLPAAVMGMILVYCFRHTKILATPHGIPELIAVAVTVGLHVWKRNFLISIAAGTVSYMLLVQLVFGAYF